MKASLVFLASVISEAFALPQQSPEMSKPGHCTAAKAPKLQNPNFDEPSNPGWTNDFGGGPTGAVGWAYDCQHSGGCADLQLNTGTLPNSTVGIYQCLQVCKGAMYDVTFSYRFGAEQAQGHTYYLGLTQDRAKSWDKLILDTGRTAGRDSAGVAYGQWGTVTGILTAKSDTLELGFYMLSPKGETAWVDLDSVSIKRSS